MQPLTRDLIEASDKRWIDLSYLRLLTRRPNLVGRKKRAVKTIALYYWRMHDGGTERVTSLLAAMWSSLGYRVVLLTDELPSKKDYPYGTTVERRILPPHRGRYAPRGTALAQILLREGVDVFVTNQWYDMSTVWDMLIAKSLGIPAVIGWHNVFDAGLYEGEHVDAFRARLLAYRHADLITVLTTTDQYWFSSQGFSARLVPNPLTFSPDDRPVRNLSSKTVLWMGRVEQHQKRVLDAIRAFAIVAQAVPEAVLLVVGDGPDRKRAEALAAALGISKNVQFTGYASDVTPHLNRASLHIMTSEFEGAPMVLSEVWAHGIPTVMYDLPYLQYLQSGKGFRAVEQEDVDALASEIVEVLTHDSMRRRLGAEAKAVSDQFASIDVPGLWRRIFSDLETADDMGHEVTSEQAISVAPIVAHQLVQKLYAVDRRVSRYRVPKWAEPLIRVGRGVRRARGALVTAAFLPARVARKARDLRPGARFAPLRMVDLSQVGLGDNLMLWTGLYALLDSGLPVCDDHCTIHVPGELADLCRHVFGRFGCRVETGRPARPASPIFSPLPPETAQEAYKAYIGIDWRMNWVEALDLQKTFPRLGASPTLKSRLRLRISEYVLYDRSDWRAAKPEYIGYRVWLPLARKLGVMPATFLGQMKRSFGAIRQSVSQFVDLHTAVPTPDVAGETAIFPCGKSFQSMPPETCLALQSASASRAVTFYIQNDDPWLPQFVAAGIAPVHLDSIVQMMKVIKHAGHLVTTDSFSSHVAQLLRDDFVLVLTRDLRENIVHPAANPRIVANHPGCAPCNYHGRSDLSTCLAGYAHCIAFDSRDFVREIARATAA
ncbi:glycosyltransferase [Phreatobacter sp. AB_2022a]|uniref:glycosyltransferase n=1 Tax=Phreatobacter sp. AB_2022a TaxID=3003134 RepID=UPI002286EBF5|nr:glycosyltransferase [Phreatobacter sp. AB_2022a]MCZ0738390.1 glycosyltransferase [Phreatobacter sp. AB_2022a]